MRTNILFADDDSDIRELVEFQLHAAGFDVSTTDNAADVLRLVTTERFDALLLDYWMTEVSGIELCRQIRTFDQSTPDIDLLWRSYRSRQRSGNTGGRPGICAKAVYF